MLLLSIDPSLGRLDYDSLSDQALMEMLADSLGEKYRSVYQDQNGNYDDVCEWYGVKCVNDRVVRFQRTKATCSEPQCKFEWIPPLVTYFSFTESRLRGTLDLAVLPRGLVDLYLRINALHGTLNFQAFPPKIANVSIHTNEFSGKCALPDLPDSLVCFHAFRNKFSGEISLRNLPSSLKQLNLSENALTGEIHIAALPQGITRLDLTENLFTGDVRVLEFPPSLTYLGIKQNPLSGTAVLAHTAEPTRELWFDHRCMVKVGTFMGLTKILDENGNPHRHEAEWLDQ